MAQDLALSITHVWGEDVGERWAILMVFGHQDEYAGGKTTSGDVAADAW
jgi:hypothetical protein